MNRPLDHSQNGSTYFLMVSACLLLLLSFGYRSSFGLFVKPITEANGWGREVVSMALAIQNLFWGIVAVFAGGLADRLGNVKVVVAGRLFYALGMVPPTSGLMAVMFGTRYMAMLYGIVFLGHQLGSFSGVWLYDRSGSYDMVWWLGVAFGVMAAIVHWPIQEQPVLRLAVQFEE